MGDEIVVIAPRDINESKALSKDLAASALMPLALRKKPEDVLAIVLTGAELGLAPMQSVRGIHIINGKASLSADLMGALVKRSPLCEYLQLGESTGQVATYKTKRKGETGETVISFTIEQAKAAGLNGDNWRKYPDAMLRARCLAAICRAVYPDLCLGLYDSDSGELEDDAPRDVTPQSAHVASVKEQLRAQVNAPVTVEGTATRVESAPAVTEAPTMEEEIRGTTTLAALRALIPALKNLSREEQAKLKPLFDVRKTEIAAVAQ